MTTLQPMQPVDWAMHIMQTVAAMQQVATAAPGPSCVLRWGTNPGDDDAMIGAVEMQLSELVERHWGDADELEALQWQLARQEVRQALAGLLRAGGWPLPPPR